MRIWRWLRCLVLGHHWVFLFRSGDKSLALCHLHPMAGEDHYCVACGAYWDDARAEHRRLFYAGVAPGPPPGRA